MGREVKARHSCDLLTGYRAAPAQPEPRCTTMQHCTRTHPLQTSQGPVRVPISVANKGTGHAKFTTRGPADHPSQRIGGRPWAMSAGVLRARTGEGVHKNVGQGGVEHTRPNPLILGHCCRTS